MKYVQNGIHPRALKHTDQVNINRNSNNISLKWNLDVKTMCQIMCFMCAWALKRLHCLDASISTLLVTINQSNCIDVEYRWMCHLFSKYYVYVSFFLLSLIPIEILKLIAIEKFQRHTLFILQLYHINIYMKLFKHWLCIMFKNLPLYK